MSCTALWPKRISGQPYRGDCKVCRCAVSPMKLCIIGVPARCATHQSGSSLLVNASGLASTARCAARSNPTPGPGTEPGPVAPPLGETHEGHHLAVAEFGRGRHRRPARGLLRKASADALPSGAWNVPWPQCGCSLSASRHEARRASPALDCWLRVIQPVAEGFCSSTSGSTRASAHHWRRGSYGADRSALPSDRSPASGRSDPGSEQNRPTPWRAHSLRLPRRAHPIHQRPRPLRLRGLPVLVKPCIEHMCEYATRARQTLAEDRRLWITATAPGCDAASHAAGRR